MSYVTHDQSAGPRSILVKDTGPVQGCRCAAAPTTESNLKTVEVTVTGPGSKEIDSENLNLPRPGPGALSKSAAYPDPESSHVQDSSLLPPKPCPSFESVTNLPSTSPGRLRVGSGHGPGVTGTVTQAHWLPGPRRQARVRTESTLIAAVQCVGDTVTV